MIPISSLGYELCNFHYAISLLSIPNSWIGNSVEDIGNKVAKKREYSGYTKDGHHHRIIPREDGLVAQTSNPGPGKDSLHNDRTPD